MGLFGQTMRELFVGRNRVAISTYPSANTPELERAWKQPQFRYNWMSQPYTDPLTMPGGNSVLNGETWEMRREYREWAFREPTTKAALLTKCFAVASLDPLMNPDDEDDARSNEVAEWALWSLMHAFGGVGGLVQNMLLPGTFDGFSMNEPVWDEVKDGMKYRGFWTPKRYHMVDTEHIRFALDPYRQVIGVRPMTGLTGGWTELPPEDFIIFTHLKVFENPFGISDFRAVVRDCRLLENAIKLRDILLNNFSGPFLWATANSQETRRAVAAVLGRAREQGFIVVPEGTELQVINLATSNPQVFDSVIQSYRESIVSAIQGGYLQLLEGGVSDARGSTNVHRGISELFQWWLALWVCEVINAQLIPRIVRPNYGNSVGLPRLQLGGVDENTINTALDRFKRGQELGLDLSKKQVRKTGYFEVPRDQMDTLSPPAQQSGANDPFGGLFNPTAGKPPTDPNNPGGGGSEWKPGPNPNDPSETGYVNGNGTFRKDNPAASQMKGGTGTTVVTFR